MHFDESLATRVREVLRHRTDVTERRMFGGPCFRVASSMACGIVKTDLCVRVGPDRYEEALAASHTRPMDFTGRPLRGFVYVAPEGLKSAARALKKWIEMGVAYALFTPPKSRPG
jgi:hypothetical protein